MHGAEAHTEGRIYTGVALRALGVPVSASLEAAADDLAARNFAFLPIDALSPKVADMLELRPILGLRSPVHTFARMLNPFGAPCMLQGDFHPNYMAIHAAPASCSGSRGLRYPAARAARSSVGRASRPIC
jgi:anthranilate phosphoribosyltransferase